MAGITQCSARELGLYLTNYSSISRKHKTVLKYMMACLQHLGVSSGCKGSRGLVDSRDGIDGMEQIVAIFYCMIFMKFKLIYKYLLAHESSIINLYIK